MMVTMKPHRLFFRLSVVAAVLTASTVTAAATTPMTSLTSSSSSSSTLDLPQKSLKAALEEHLTKTSTPRKDNRKDVAFQQYMKKKNQKNEQINPTTGNNNNNNKKAKEEEEKTTFTKDRTILDEDTKLELIAKYGITPLDNVENPSELIRRGIGRNDKTASARTDTAGVLSKKKKKKKKSDTAKTTMTTAATASLPFVADSGSASIGGSRRSDATVHDLQGLKSDKGNTVWERIHSVSSVVAAGKPSPTVSGKSNSDQDKERGLKTSTTFTKTSPTLSLTSKSRQSFMEQRGKTPANLSTLRKEPLDGIFDNRFSSRKGKFHQRHDRQEQRSVQTFKHDHHVHKERQLQSSDPFEVCVEFLIDEMAFDESLGTECECFPDGNGTLLFCQDTACQYCDVTLETCALVGYGQRFNSEGMEDYFFNEVYYISGRNDTIEVFFDTSSDTGACDLYINGEGCDSCMEVLDECPDDMGTYLELNCTNIPGAGNVPGCGPYSNPESPLGIISEVDFLQLCNLTSPSEAYCQQLKEQLSYGDSGYDCGCYPSNFTDGNTTILSCVDDCLYCNDMVEDCAQLTIEIEFDSDGNGVDGGASIVYDNGDTLFYRPESLVSNLFGDGTAGNCTVVANGIVCDSCLDRNCTMGDFVAPLVDCENFQAGQSYDFCEPDSTPVGPFAFFSDEEYDECISEGDLQCLEFTQPYESDGLFCDCYADTYYFKLECIDPYCGLCNDEQTVCGYDAFEERRDGDSETFTQIFQYGVGRTERVEYREVYFGDGSTGCSLQVDGDYCNFCMVQNCTDFNSDLTSTAPFLDCSNLEENATMDFCLDNDPGDGIFQFASLSAAANCTDLSPPNDMCDMGDASIPIPIDGTVVIGSTYFAGVSDFNFVVRQGLWYTIMVANDTALKASTCNNETDFEAVVDLFEGPCDDLAVVDSKVPAATTCGPSASAVSWYARAGQVYHLHVGGIDYGYPRNVGTFGLTVEETDLSLDSCTFTAETLMYDGYVCECREDFDGTTLNCTDDCLYCNSVVPDTCATREFGAFFDASGSTSIRGELWTYVSGRNESVLIDRFDCLESSSSSCGSCEVYIDGTQCTSCELPYRFTEELSVDCTNVEPGAVLNTLDYAVDDGILQPLAPYNFDVCVRDPFEACVESFPSYDYNDINCTCVESLGFVVQACEADFACSFCSPDGTVCAGPEITGPAFNTLGEEVGFYQYVELFRGFTGSLEYINVWSSNECVLAYNGVQCNSCMESYDCMDESGNYFQGFSIDCSNVQDGAVVNTCSMNGYNGTMTDSVVDFFAGGAFDVCLPQSASGEVECQTRLEEEESYVFDSPDCQCSETSTGTFKLKCRRLNCLFCNAIESVCSVPTYGYEFSNVGEVIGQLSGYDYVKGLTHSVDVVTGFDFDMPSCTASVDDEMCESCDVCVSVDQYGYPVDEHIIMCDNLGYGMSNPCDNMTMVSPDSPFIQDNDPSFETCLFSGGTLPPTTSPTAGPTMVASESPTAVPTEKMTPAPVTPAPVMTTPAPVETTPAPVTAAPVAPTASPATDSSSTTRTTSVSFVTTMYGMLISFGFFFVVFL